MTNCPYCQDGELLTSVELENDLDENGDPRVIEPKGGVLVCGSCLMAVDPSEDEGAEPEPGIKTDEAEPEAPGPQPLPPPAPRSSK